MYIYIYTLIYIYNVYIYIYYVYIYIDVCNKIQFDSQLEGEYYRFQFKFSDMKSTFWDPPT